MGIHRYLHICGCSKSGNQFIANLIGGTPDRPAAGARSRCVGPAAVVGQHHAGFTSAIILAMITLLIGYESFSRILSPVSIHIAEAIPISFSGLAVNFANAWLPAVGDIVAAIARCRKDRS